MLARVTEHLVRISALAHFPARVRFSQPGRVLAPIFALISSTASQCEIARPNDGTGELNCPFSSVNADQPEQAGTRFLSNLWIWILAGLPE